MEIDLEVRYGLASVQDEDRTYFMRTLDDRGDVGDGTRGVTHVGDGHDLGTLGDDFVEVVRTHTAVLGQVDPLEGGTGAVCQLLERQQHRMMFRTRDDNLIARLQGKTLGGFSPTPQRCIAECGGEQVQSGRGTTGDDDLLFTFGRIRADQLGHLGSGLLKGHGATGGQLVRTTVHAGVNCTVEVRLGVDHRIRLLRGGRRIQVHERVPVNLLIQNRELRPNRRKINHCFP